MLAVKLENIFLVVHCVYWWMNVCIEVGYCVFFIFAYMCRFRFSIASILLQLLEFNCYFLSFTHREKLSVDNMCDLQWRLRLSFS